MVLQSCPYRMLGSPLWLLHMYLNNQAVQASFQKHKQICKERDRWTEPQRQMVGLGGVEKVSQKNTIKHSRTYKSIDNTGYKAFPKISVNHLQTKYMAEHTLSHNARGKSQKIITYSVYKN